MGGNISVTSASQSQHSQLQQSRLSTFLLRTLQQWLTMLFNEPGDPQKLPLPLGGLDPHLIHGSLGPPKSHTQTASRLVHLFCRAHGFDQQTDRHTDRPRYALCSNRQYRAIAEKRPKIQHSTAEHNSALAHMVERKDIRVIRPITISA